MSNIITVNQTYPYKVAKKLRAEAKEFANTVPKMELRAGRVITMARSCYLNLCPQTAKKVFYFSQHFWAEAKKAQNWLNAYPDNCPGYRTAKKAYTELVAIAKKVERQTRNAEAALRSDTPLNRLQVHTRPTTWDAWCIARADNLTKDEYKIARYIARNPYIGNVQYHVYYIDHQTFGVKVYNELDKRTREFIIPKKHRNTVLLLMYQTREENWFGRASGYYNCNRWNLDRYPQMTNK